MSKIRDEMAEKYYLEWICGDKPSFKAFKDGWDAALKNAPQVLALVEASIQLRNLESDYQNSDTRDISFHYQYWKEEKSRRVDALDEGLTAYLESVKK